MKTQEEKAQDFQSLHTQPGCFVIPNPWDAGSAKMLASLGFKALATTSAGLSSSLGLPDGQGLISKEDTLANARDIVLASDLPVSADLENGFHHQPDGVFDTIKSAGNMGLVGASIEDATGDPNQAIYAFELAVERIRAGVDAKKAMPFPFMLTARAENFCHGIPNLKDTIKRLQAFQDAGADVLYAPGLIHLHDIATLVKEVDRPVNDVMGLSGANVSVQELTDIGVKRISLGSSLHRTAFGSLLSSANEILNEGTFRFAEKAVSFSALDKIFKDN
jgi:2-methylisocitrate lyase-like PEP mutase family enzyme